MTFKYCLYSWLGYAIVVANPASCEDLIPWQKLTIQGFGYGVTQAEVYSVHGDPDKVTSHLVYNIQRYYFKPRICLEVVRNPENFYQAWSGRLVGRQIEFKGNVVAIAGRTKRSEVESILGPPNWFVEFRACYDYQLKWDPIVDKFVMLWAPNLQRPTEQR